MARSGTLATVRRTSSGPLLGESEHLCPLSDALATKRLILQRAEAGYLDAPIRRHGGLQHYGEADGGTPHLLASHSRPFAVREA